MALPTATKATPLTVKRTAGLQAGRAHLLIYGKTKAGKTSTAVTLEENPKHNAIICTQPETQLTHLLHLDIPYVIVRDFQDLKQAIDEAQKGLFPDMKTLIIDDFTEAVDFKRAHEEGINGRIGDGVFATFRNVMRWADTTLRTLLDTDFNLIITAFERELKEEGSPVQWIGPELPPSTASVVMAKFDFIMHLNNYKLRVKKDETKRIMAGNRWPVAKVSQLQDEVAPNLKDLWSRYQIALKA